MKKLDMDYVMFQLSLHPEHGGSAVLSKEEQTTYLEQELSQLQVAELYTLAEMFESLMNMNMHHIESDR